MAKVNKFTTPAGIAKYPHLNSPDTAFDTDNPKYKTEILMSEEDAAPLIAQIKAAALEIFGAKANYRMPVTKDDETGQVSIKAQSKYLPKFYDTQGQIIVETALPKIGAGSTLKLGGLLNVYTVSGTKGVSLMLDRVQVIDVVNGFGGLDDGFDAVDNGSFVVETFENGSPAPAGVLPTGGINAELHDF
tara:strand:- start:1510 stop:2076 length:567 start_codon:yes stop_codon:yes gene_type:complete